MSDAALQIVIDRWADVVKENNADKDLVDEQQRVEWENFEKKTTERLRAIVNGYDGGELKQTDSDWLANLERTISKADRVDRETLEARKAAREEEELRKQEEERLRLEAEEQKRKEVANTKASLLDKLKF